MNKMNIMKKMNFNFCYRIFNRGNITKVFIIFIVGFISRFLVNQFFGVNVFLDFTNNISLLYYLVMSCFVVFVHELVAYFEFSVIPSSLITWFNNIPKVSLNALKLSSIRNTVAYIKGCGLNKVTLSENINNNSNKSLISNDNDNVKSSNASFMNNDSGKQSRSNHKHSGYKQSTSNKNGGSFNSQIGNSRSSQPKSGYVSSEHNLRHYNKSNNIRDLSKAQQANNSVKVSQVNNGNVGQSQVKVHVQPAYNQSLAGYNKPSASDMSVSQGLYTINESPKGNSFVKERAQPANSFGDNRNAHSYNKSVCDNNVQRHLSASEGVEGTLGVYNNNIEVCREKKWNFPGKFKDKSKLVFYWIVSGEFKSEFNSYKEFKQSWDPNTKVFKEIRKDINVKVENKMHSLRLKHRTFNWFLNLRK